MLPTVTGGKTASRQKRIDIREVFNLWDILNSKYITVELIQVREAMAHDPDLVFSVTPAYGRCPSEAPKGCPSEACVT